MMVYTHCLFERIPCQCFERVLFTNKKKTQDPYVPDPYYTECEKIASKPWKPERSGFCSIKRQLVPRMDHYCPFVLGTVGHSNHGVFFLLCLYHCLGISLGLLGFGRWCYYEYLPFLRDGQGHSLALRLAVSAFLLVDASTCLSLLSFTTYMASYNFGYIFNNQTTLEWYRNDLPSNYSGELRSTLL